ESLPKDSPQELWNLQRQLDKYAQSIFGPRNSKKKLLAPEFNADAAEGPHVSNTIDLDGGYASLSTVASTSWYATVYELAHETIHLLDPRPAPPFAKGSNWFEEGIAVEFALHCTEIVFGERPAINSPTYETAWNLTKKIVEAKFFNDCKNIRLECGHFADANFHVIKKHAPKCDSRVIIELIKRFDNTPIQNV
ncbi:hypothetical protein, partial [Candidatus Symbiopectobacterium sp. NZEC135]